MIQKLFTDKKLKGIVVAMDAELSPVLDILKPYQTFKFLDRTFFYNDSAIAVKSGIGELSSASAAESLIALLGGKQNLDSIINVGLCGSLHDGYKVGDILMVKDVVHYDFDVTGIDNVQKGQYPGAESQFLSADISYFDSLQKIYEDKIKLVRCASGDKFISDIKIQKQIVQDFSADICEMEAAGVILTAGKHGIPVIIIKAVSDVVSSQDSLKDFKESKDTVTKNYIDVLKLILEDKVTRTIASFNINHNKLEEGFYTSRVDDDIYTYDLRFTKPNKGDYLSLESMHSAEHLVATALRNGKDKDKIIYFGPMGCRTGFYLLLKNADYDEAKRIIETALESIASAKEVDGTKEIECGNAACHSLEAAQKDCKEYLKKIKGKKFKYPAY
ncbi:S-ribosylhomocysteine lyase [Endomicrobium proavitum]|uniref:S-ribosylhomocysteine lyase n=1 Tax=Endomicrobium proavitum TaxID=1408281 RepID=A0A0G3WGF7_9BACT|nr:S-ribosylhomocysteine lyase [Endomicrobium proavitum]AKL97761.1 S-ribosylhomocysteine lyase (modular protein) [Endomicrobium proavitum]